MRPPFRFVAPCTLLLLDLALSACSLDTVPLERPRELHAGAGCRDLAGHYTNTPQSATGYLLSQLFFDLEPGQHLAISSISLQPVASDRLSVTARTGAHELAARETELACKDGRWTLAGQSYWRTEGAGMVALLRRSHRVWLARDAGGALVTEVQQKNTGLILASIPVATYHTAPLGRYPALPATAASVAVAPADGTTRIDRLCAVESVAFCATGVGLDEEGSLSSANLWSLLGNTPLPDGLTHVTFEADADGRLSLNGWAGSETAGRRSLEETGLRCVNGKLDTASEAGLSALGGGTGSMSVAGMGVGVAWGKLQLTRADDGALLVRTVVHYAGTVAVLMPIYFDFADWHRFAPVASAGDWSTCPGIPANSDQPGG